MKENQNAYQYTIAKLKNAGILSNSNISNPEKEIFQSDTGEITLRAKEKLMKVVTSRTEAISMLSGRSERLKQLDINNSSVAATIAVCSVDGAPLESSKRLVLLYITEVANTDMELSFDRVKMINPGKLPILLKTGKLSAYP